MEIEQNLGFFIYWACLEFQRKNLTLARRLVYATFLSIIASIKPVTQSLLDCFQAKSFHQEIIKELNAQSKSQKGYAKV